MKCHNCKKDTKSAYKFCEELYCYKCLEEYVQGDSLTWFGNYNNWIKKDKLYK